MADKKALSESNIKGMYQAFLNDNPSFDISNKNIEGTEEDRLALLPNKNNEFKGYIADAFGEEFLNSYSKEFNNFIEKQSNIETGKIYSLDDNFLQKWGKKAILSNSRGLNSIGVTDSSSEEMAAKIGANIEDDGFVSTVVGEVSRIGTYSAAGAGVGAGVGVFFGGVGAAPGAAIGGTIGGLAAAGLDFIDTLKSNYEQVLAETGDESKAIQAAIATAPVAALEFVADAITMKVGGLALKTAKAGLAKTGVSVAAPMLTKGMFSSTQKVSHTIYDALTKSITKTNGTLLKESAKAAGLEGVSEAFLGEYLNNEIVDSFIDGNYYEPTFKGLLKTALIGATVGGVTRAGFGVASGEGLTIKDVNATETNHLSNVVIDTLLDIPNTDNKLSGKIFAKADTVNEYLNNARIGEGKLSDVVEAIEKNGKVELIKKVDIFDDSDKANAREIRPENIKRIESQLQALGFDAVNETIGDSVKTAEESRLLEERNNTSFDKVLSEDKNSLIKTVQETESLINQNLTKIEQAKSLLADPNSGVDKFKASDSIKALETETSSLFDVLDSKIAKSLQLDDNFSSGLIQQLNKGGENFTFKDFVESPRNYQEDLANTKTERLAVEEFAKKRLETENEIKSYVQPEGSDVTPAKFKEQKRKEFYDQTKDSLPTISSFLTKYEKIGGSKSGFKGIKSKTINDLIKIGTKPETNTIAQVSAPIVKKPVNNQVINKKIEAVRDVLKNKVVKDPNQLKSVRSFLDNYKPDKEYEALKENPLTEQDLIEARNISDKFESDRTNKKQEVIQKKEEKKRTIEDQRRSNRLELKNETIKSLSPEARGIYDLLDPNKKAAGLKSESNRLQTRINKESISGTVESLKEVTKKAEIINEVINAYKSEHPSDPVVSSIETIARGKKKVVTNPTTNKASSNPIENSKPAITQNEPSNPKNFDNIRTATLSNKAKQKLLNFSSKVIDGIILGKETYNSKINTIANSAVRNNLNDSKIKEIIKKDFAKEENKTIPEILSDVRKAIAEKQKAISSKLSENRTVSDITKAEFSNGTPELAKGMFDRIREQYVFNRPFNFITREELESSGAFKEKDIAKINSDFDNNSATAIYYPSLNKHTIVLDLSKINSDKDLVHTIAHEVGHAYVADHFSSLSNPQKVALRNDYESFLNRVGVKFNPDGTIITEGSNFNQEQFIKEQFPYLPNTSVSKDLNYNTMFSEWIANEFAKASGNLAQPSSSFVSNLMNHIKRLFNKLVKNISINYDLPAPSVRDIMSGIPQSLRGDDNFYNMTMQESQFKDVLYNKLPLEKLKEVREDLIPASYSIKEDKDSIIKEVSTYLSKDGASYTKGLLDILNQPGITTTNAKEAVTVLQHLFNSNIFEDSLSRTEGVYLGVPFYTTDNNVFLISNTGISDTIAAIGSTVYNNFVTRIDNGAIREELIKRGKKLNPHATSLDIGNSFYEQLGFADYFRNKILGLNNNTPLTDKLFSKLINNSDVIGKDLFKTSSRVLQSYFDQDPSKIQELSTRSDLKTQFSDDVKDKPLYSRIKNFIIGKFFHANYTSFSEIAESKLGRNLQIFEDVNKLDTALGGLDGSIKSFIDSGLKLGNGKVVTPLKQILGMIPRESVSKFHNYLMSRSLIERESIIEEQKKAYKRYNDRISKLEENNPIVTSKERQPLVGELDYMPAPLEVPGSTININASKETIKNLTPSEARLFSDVAEKFYEWKNDTLQYLKEWSPSMADEIDVLLNSNGRSYVPIRNSQEVRDSELVMLKKLMKREKVFEKFGNSITGDVLDPVTATLFQFVNRLKMVVPREKMESMINLYNESIRVGNPITGITRIRTADFGMSPETIDIANDYGKAKRQNIKKFNNLVSGEKYKKQIPVFTKEMAQFLDTFAQTYEADTDLGDSKYFYVKKKEGGEDVIYAFEKAFAKEFLTTQKDIPSNDPILKYLRALSSGTKALIHLTVLKVSPPYYLGQIMSDFTGGIMNTRNQRGIKIVADYARNLPFAGIVRESLGKESQSDQFVKNSGIGSYNFIMQNNEPSIEAISKLYEPEVRHGATGKILNLAKKGLKTVDKTLELIMDEFDKVGRKAEIDGYLKDNNLKLEDLTWAQRIELVHAARTVTSNFYQKGSLTKSLSHIFPLISGNLAGLGAGVDRFSLAVKNKDAKYFLKLGSFMGLAVASALELEELEWFKSLSDDEKRDRFHFKVGDNILSWRMQHPLLITTKGMADIIAKNVESPQAFAISIAQQLSGVSAFSLSPVIKLAGIAGNRDFNKIDGWIRGEDGVSSEINKNYGSRGVVNSLLTSPDTSKIAIDIAEVLSSGGVDSISPRQIDLTIKALGARIGIEAVKLFTGKTEDETLRESRQDNNDMLSFFMGSYVKNEKMLLASKTAQKAYGQSSELINIINSASESLKDKEPVADIENFAGYLKSLRKLDSQLGQAVDLKIIDRNTYATKRKAVLEEMLKAMEVFEQEYTVSSRKIDTNKTMNERLEFFQRAKEARIKYDRLNRGIDKYFKSREASK